MRFSDVLFGGERIVLCIIYVQTIVSGQISAPESADIPCSMGGVGTAVLKILKPRGVQGRECVALKSQLNLFISSGPFDVVQVQFKVQQLNGTLNPLVLTRKKAREKVDQRD